MMYGALPFREIKTARKELFFPRYSVRQLPPPLPPSPCGFIPIGECSKAPSCLVALFRLCLQNFPVPFAAKGFLRGTLVVAREQRLLGDAVLAHPWLSTVNLSMLEQGQLHSPWRPIVVPPTDSRRER